MDYKSKRLFSFLMFVVIIAVLIMQTACTASTESKTFTFTAVFYDQTTRSETITTTKSTLGEALEEKGFIETSDGMVLSVFGTDYDDFATSNSMVYWAFYIGEDFATEGVFKTELTEGAEYFMKAESYNW